MNIKKLRFMVEKGETLPLEAQRQLIGLGEVALFKQYIQKHFIHPTVEPELLKATSRELLAANIANDNWLSASTQRLMMEDEYIGAFKLYTSKLRLKKELLSELISPQHLLQFETYLANGNYLNREAENLLLKPENKKVLVKCLQNYTLSKEFQIQLLQPQYRAQFEIYIQYRYLSPSVESLLLKPENFALFILYNKRYCLQKKNQIKMLEINRPELTKAFLKKWHISRYAKAKMEEHQANRAARLSKENTVATAQ